jgi:single-stranded-DNA-specific exonuclease
MEKEDETLEHRIEKIAEKFREKISDSEIQVVSHFDTDGITSAAIMIQALKKMDRPFSLRIVKNLDEESIKKLSKDKVTVFLDLASNSIHHIIGHGLRNVFIIDHHEIIQDIPDEISMVNPQLHDKQKISASGLVYLFCRQLDNDARNYAKLAVLGMIGDFMEKNIDRLNNEILDDGNIRRKRGLLIYPATRPLNRVLELSSQPYIPGVTGNISGVVELLRSIGINPVNGTYKSLMELDEMEMGNLITAVLLRNPSARTESIVGDIFLIKFFNKLEDAREISAKINACSRSGESAVAVQLCMELPKAMKKSEAIYAKYKQEMVSALNFASGTEKAEGRGFVILNAKDNIKDTMIGTVMSIISNSNAYQEGTVLVGMAYSADGIKVSGRNVGKIGRNVREILQNVVGETGGEVGGHEFAAGCNISRKDEEKFIGLLKKEFEM